MAHKLAVVITPSAKYEAYCIPKPDGFEFADDTHAKDGEYITVKVKADSDDKLEITEVEGIPTSDESDSNEEDDSISMPDFGDQTDNSDDEE